MQVSVVYAIERTRFRPRLKPWASALLPLWRSNRQLTGAEGRVDTATRAVTHALSHNRAAPADVGRESVLHSRGNAQS